MILKSKQELYDYLNNFDYASKKENELCSVYFLVQYNGLDRNNNERTFVEPLYFSPYEDVYFASPCVVRECSMSDEDLEEYVHEMYYDDSFQKALEYEKLFQRGDKHYEMDNPQVSPFLPEKIEIIQAMSETECLNWILENWKKA